ncbi:hypothetical protein M3Y97_00382600 [Aphelenchoides bicaudatus]|nr:hypothetical protein M3Y97_00382600 [Aphelenchoides bicaudatus]
MADDRFKSKQLTDEFQQRFQSKPTAIIRCPGRVNLIGEHIDYSGYGVFPMALSQSIYIALSRNDSNTLKLENLSSQFESHTHDLSTEWNGTTNPRWYHYFMSGYVGALNHLKASGDVDFSGLDVLVYGEVPPGAGLSSSSALVSASVLATLIAYTGKVFDGYTKQQLAEIAIKSERFVGTEGGGMDQAVAVLASDGSALRVDFEPLTSYTVQLPSNSLFGEVTANKAANNLYNQRVVECRISAQILYRKLVDSDSTNWQKIRRLKDLQEALKESLAECGKQIDSLLKAQPYTRDEVLKELNTSDDDLRQHSLNSNTQEMKEFKLHSRAKHVFEEAQRVHDFEKACQKGDLKLMSQLMDKSHESCKELYECSCPELDVLVKKCRDAGCLGARLTGAGWGGCLVTLTTKEDKERVEKQLNILFWTEPAGGIEALLF